MNTQNLAGQTIGQYQLRELLGLGGMGAVYRAYQENLRRSVAIKILPSVFATQSDYIARFIREAQTSAALEHTHIVPVYDYGTVNDVTFVVMRLLSGGTLEDRLTQTTGVGIPLPALVETATILKQLASALDYAHSRGVIHRDIKATNIMFDNQGSAFLVDFGIAKLMSAASVLTGTGTLMGTPSYMAPEQWRGEDVFPSTDQYALGVTVYALVTGKLPYEATTPYALMHQHLNESLPPPQTWRTDLPEAVQLVLERAMAKKQEDRFPTATGFALAFEQAISGIGGQPTGFFSTPLPPKPTAPLQTLTPDPVVPPSADETHWYTRPWVWGIAALIFVSVVVMILLALSGGGTSLSTPTVDSRQILADSTDAPDNTDTPEVPSPIPTRIVVIVPTPNPTATQTPAPTMTPNPSVTPAPTHTDLPPTFTPTSTPTATASATETLDGVQAARATYDRFQTATADTWTDTPTPTITLTPDITQTIKAVLTAFHNDDLTATATLWTPTPTVTQTFTPTPTNTPTPTATSTAAPATVTPDSNQFSSVAHNADWIPQSQTFNGVKMMLVPSGCFMMGSESGAANESPVHQQCFDQPFWIDYTEVTNAQYGSSGAFNGDNFPRESMDWFEARDFCQSRAARLPTEAEWEYAARGTDALVYPWGDSWIPDNLVYRDGTHRQTNPVGSLPSGASWVGALDMAGNVWEWTSSIYKPYPYNAFDGREDAADSTSSRVLKGGSWDFGNADVAQSSWRGGDGYTLISRDNGIGFRCVRDFDAAALMSAEPAQIAFRSDRDGNWEVYVMDADGANLHNLSNNPADDQFPVWSPDGEQIAFVSNRDGNDEIYVMDAHGSNPHNLTNHRAADTVPTWSPDGQQLAFVSARNGNWEIYVMDSDGDNVRNLTNNRAEDFTPAWSPDGVSIVFHSNRDGGFEIYVMDTNGGNVRRLTNNTTDDFAPTWSSDGRSILFQSNWDGNSEIYMMDANGGNSHNLTNNPADDFNPDWSSDSEKIAFSSNRDGQVEVYIMENDGTEQHRLTDNNANDSSPSWRHGSIAPSVARAATPVVMIVTATPTAIPEGVICPGVLPSRLMVGLYARELPGVQGNRVRVDPGTRSSQIGRIPPGRMIRVLNGPVCAENYAWWQVYHDGVTGWTVEGSGNAYWLEPVGAPDQNQLEIDYTITNDNFQMVFQSFERGYMFYLRPIGQIWVLVTDAQDGGYWMVYDDLYEDSEPEIDPSIEAPSDLQQPRRGFGRLWRDHPEVREALGWAVATEAPVAGNYQYIPASQTHILLGTHDQRFELNTDGTWLFG